MAAGKQGRRLVAGERKRRLVAGGRGAGLRCHQAGMRREAHGRAGMHRDGGVRGFGR